MCFCAIQAQISVFGSLLACSSSLLPFIYFQVLKQHGSCEASIAALKKQVADLEQNLDDANKEHAPCSALIDALKKQVDEYGCACVRVLLLTKEDTCTETCASIV